MYVLLVANHFSPIPTQLNSGPNPRIMDEVLAPGSHYTLPKIWTYMRHHYSNTKRVNVLDLEVENSLDQKML